MLKYCCVCFPLGILALGFSNIPKQAKDKAYSSKKIYRIENRIKCTYFWFKKNQQTVIHWAFMFGIDRNNLH